MELLIHTFERPNHGGGGYLPGDIITVKPDGWKWGREEVRTFFVVRLSDDAFDAATWRRMAEPQTAFEDDAKIPGEKRKVTLRQRRFYLDMGHVAASRKAALLRRDVTKAIAVSDFSARHVVDKESLSPRFTAKRVSHG